MTNMKHRLSMLILLSLLIWLVWQLNTNQLATAQASVFNHHFPWKAGLSAKIIAIDECREAGCNVKTHKNQIDFGVQPNTSGEVVASKAGTVAFVKESSTVGGCNFNLWQYANLVVVRHAWNEYSWYVHLAHNSVPVYVGQQIKSGTVLGRVGMTGNTCSLHLHYMVSRDHSAWTNPNNALQAPWARQIMPINFIEVPWPHLYSQTTYLSQNILNIPKDKWKKAKLWSNKGHKGIVLWDGYTGFNNGPDARGESLELPKGWSAIIYGYDNRWGRSQCVNASVPDLSWIKWKNSIRSIDVYDYNICGGGKW